MSEQAGAVNRYTCEVCGQYFTTINAVDGVTPFMTTCRATEGCDGSSVSAMYRVAQIPRHATHEWYMPDREELHRMADESGERIVEKHPPGSQYREDYPITDDELMEIGRRHVLDHAEHGGLFLQEITSDSQSLEFMRLRHG